MMETKEINEIQKVVWNYYNKHGRHKLPWRKTTNPYRILVSEVMLQQTQVSRVLPKYKAFLKKFPTINHLSQTSVEEVLRVWQGLGYNRRAKHLYRTAVAVINERKGCFPKTINELKELPGVGEYTARAICAFAYKEAVPLLETNIRTALIYHFFRHRKKITDMELFNIAEKILVIEKPREWNWALMDYGAYLKEEGVVTHRQSAHYTKQKPFKGSNREIRGMVIRELMKGKPLTCAKLVQLSGSVKSRIKVQLDILVQEGLIQKKSRNSWGF